MTVFNYWLQAERKTTVKVGLLILVSYFFVGISEGAFFFQNGLDTFINFLFTMFCVAANWWLFKMLNRHLKPGQESGNFRYVKQLGLILALSLFTTILNWGYIAILWREDLLQTVFFPVVLPLAVSLFAIWVFGYPWLTREKVETFVPTIKLQKGQKLVITPINDLLGFWVEHKLVFALDKEGEKFFSNESLSELEDQLTARGFFRVNRQMLLKREAIKACQTIKNDRILVELTEPFTHISNCVVSRYKAPAFREWLNSSPVSRQ